MLQTTNVVSPRIIQPSSGNDVLLNELTNILESVERNQEDYFDFDLESTATPSGGRKRPTGNRKNKKSAKSFPTSSRKVTTKRTPVDFDFEFENDFQEPRPKQIVRETSQQQQQQQQQPKTRQQQQDQQLQQIKTFINEKHQVIQVKR